MALQFIIEDGTGKTDSTSYADVADFRQYFENKGTTFTETDDEIKPWLNEATEYADNNYRWGGTKFSSTQALKIPRSDWYDCDGEDISSSVPIQLKKGVYELAYSRKGAQSISVGGSTDNTVKSKSMGPARVEYRSSTSANNGTITYPKADAWFKCLGMAPVGRVCRV